jgi:hypothetical protein
MIDLQKRKEKERKPICVFVCVLFIHHAMIDLQKIKEKEGNPTYDF